MTDSVTTTSSSDGFTKNSSISNESRANLELLQKRKVAVSSFATVTPYTKSTARQTAGSFPELDNETRTNNRSKYNVDQLVPERLRDASTEAFRRFLEAYYEFEQTYYEKSGSGVISSLHTLRDVDYGDDEVVKRLFNEFVHGFPDVGTEETKQTLLKHIKTFYQQKGSEDSFKSFFKTVFDEDPYVYYPWDDVFRVSNGDWDREDEGYFMLEPGGLLKGFGHSEGEFIGTEGFASNQKFLQDGFYYQQFSYDIRTEQLPELWEPIHKKLSHPLGFLLFTTLYLVIKQTMAPIMPLIQPGLIDFTRELKFLRLMIAECLMGIGDETLTRTYSYLLHSLLAPRTFHTDTFTRNLFRNPVHLKDIGFVAINKLEENDILFGISTYINHVESSPIEVQL
jgi:hypothetical protein